MKKINFNKYHGCGNDFIIVKEEDLENINLTTFIPQICNRTTGIGADGLLIDLKNQLGMNFYNQDGSHGTMCGNGLRSFCAYLKDIQKVTNDKFSVLTPDGIKEIETIQDNPYIFKVNLGEPVYDPKIIGIKTDKNKYINQPFQFNNQTYYGSAIYTSVKHLVVFVDDINDLYNDSLGSYLSNHEYFIDRINVDFVKVIDSENFKMKTYERGVGFTKACGTGACASYAIAKIQHKCSDNVNIHMDLGTLNISSHENDIIMIGPAQKICEGIYYYEVSNEN